MGFASCKPADALVLCWFLIVEFYFHCFCLSAFSLLVGRQEDKTV